MKLSKKQSLLFDFVKTKHGDQKRKYTGKPYYTHLQGVARIVSWYEQGCVEIALCHDLFEDTNCTFSELHKELISIGYERREAYKICSCVKELTDVFTSEDYPHLNRTARKKNEAERLSKISYKSQSVKYADLIHNTKSIVKHDANFSKIYLREKREILSLMKDGNPELLEIAEMLSFESEKDSK